MIDFNQPPVIEKYIDYVKKTIANKHICGDGEFTLKCSKWLSSWGNNSPSLFTTSGTHSLEMAILLSGIGAGDEVIMPSYTFASTADAAVLRGGIPVFVDIRPDTMNIDENLIEHAITHKTKAIMVVHYAGVACEMDTITNIAQKYDLKVIEDSAQGLMSYYKGKPLGTIGDYGCISFHETKNFSMGEGGALFIKDPTMVEEAEILREKGTNRSKFWRGEVDKYSWVGVGSSYLPSEINTAFLWAQLEEADSITKHRLDLWHMYYNGLYELEKNGCLELPYIPKYCEHNAHMFYIKTKNIEERQKLIDYLKSNDIKAVFHYIPLHSSASGLKYGRFEGMDKYTTKESERLLRLPLHMHLKEQDVMCVVERVNDFYKLGI